MKVVLTLVTPLGLPGVGEAHFENCCTEITTSILFFWIIDVWIIGLLLLYVYFIFP